MVRITAALRRRVQLGGSGQVLAVCGGVGKNCRSSYELMGTPFTGRGRSTLTRV